MSAFSIGKATEVSWQLPIPINEGRCRRPDAPLLTDVEGRRGNDGRDKITMAWWGATISRRLIIVDGYLECAALAVVCLCRSSLGHGILLSSLGSNRRQA